METTFEGFKIIADSEHAINDSMPLIYEIIEKIIISEMAVADFYHKVLHRGYKNRSLEPFKIRSTKKDIVLDYTGAMGGKPYQVRILF